MKWTRFELAQRICRPLPPIIAQRLRTWLYPIDRARRDAHECAVKAQTGSILDGNTKDWHFYRFSIHGYNDWRNVAATLVLAAEGDVIIEVGSNIGTETISFADIVGKDGVVHAFEPLPSHVTALRRANERSRYRNIVVHPCALSDRCGVVPFVVPPEHASGIGHVVHGDAQAQSATLQVQVATLDTLTEEIGSARLIILDIEGEEVNFLKGAKEYLQTHRPRLVLEASPRLLQRAGTSLEDLYERLEDLGYSVYCMKRFGLGRVTPGMQYEAQNWVCLSESDKMLSRRVSRYIVSCALLPCVRGVNPLSRR